MPLPEGAIRRYLDDLGGKFEARLREVKQVTKRLDERGLTQETFVAILEAPFDLEVLDKLSEPCLLALERRTSRGTEYMIYETLAAASMHYQMLSVRASVPNPIRTNLMDVIESGWTTKPETWIDITAAYTGTVMKLGDGDIEFEYKPNMPPLAGSRAYFLRDEAYRKLVCVTEGAVSSVGQILGTKVSLDVDMEALVKYHAGFFGFSVDYGDPIIYRESDVVKVGRIGELVDRFFSEGEEGIKYVSGLEGILRPRDVQGRVETSSVRPEAQVPGQAHQALLRDRALSYSNAQPLSFRAQARQGGVREDV